MLFCELRATIDAEKAVFHRTVSGARKAVFGPGALSMSEADAFVEALQRHTLYAQLKANTFCFGVFFIPEAIVIALLATEQTMTHLQEQFRVLECEMGMTEQDYLDELS